MLDDRPLSVARIALYVIEEHARGYRCEKRNGILYTL